MIAHGDEVLGVEPSDRSKRSDGYRAAHHLQILLPLCAITVAQKNCQTRLDNYHSKEAGHRIGEVYPTMSRAAEFQADLDQQRTNHRRVCCKESI